MARRATLTATKPGHEADAAGLRRQPFLPEGRWSSSCYIQSIVGIKNRNPTLLYDASQEYVVAPPRTTVHAMRPHPCTVARYAEDRQAPHADGREPGRCSAKQTAGQVGW